MASLTSWDKKTSQLGLEVKALLRSIAKPGERSSESFAHQRAKTNQLEQSFEENIAEILAAGQNRGYLNDSEKALLHWSTDLAKKFAQFYDNFHFSIRFIFWCRLILLQRLGTLKCKYATDVLFDILQSQENSQLERLSQARDYIEGLKKEGQNLLREYERLMIVKNNKEGLFSLQQVGSWRQLLHRFEISGKMIRSLSTTSGSQSAKERLSDLISQPFTKSPIGKRQPLRLGQIQ